MIPNDPIILLRLLNTKIRDKYRNIDEMCDDMELDREQIEKKLLSVGYKYSDARNQFV